MTPITADQANTIVTTILAEGKARNLMPLCCIVLDAGGHPMALLRHEGASIARPEIARAKAAGCIGMGFGGRSMEKRAAAVPAFMAALNVVLPHGLLPMAGGVLVRDAAGALIGAVGVSGDKSDNDEACAVAGIEAAGLVADTGA